VLEDVEKKERESRRSIEYIGQSTYLLVQESSHRDGHYSPSVPGHLLPAFLHANSPQSMSKSRK
jgi:hypothetical protein